MTRRLKRSKDFELQLIITNDRFIRPPREAQRSWLLNKVLKECAADLNHLDKEAQRLVPGCDVGGMPDRTQAVLADEEIMEDWQIPVMERMGQIVTESHGDVLEIGFGRGIASTCIQKLGVNSHTIVECNDAVVDRFHAWRKSYAGRDIRILHGRWQDVIHQMGRYDGIFFHTYPLNEQEYVDQVVQSVTFAEHFFSTAADHLKESGVFTYLTNESDSLSREHQRHLFRYFRLFTLSLVRDLSVQPDTKDSLWADTMVVIKAIK